MKAELHFGRHISDDRLEEYAFGRLCDPELSAVEEHLLVCEECQALLAGVDEWIGLMKEAGKSSGSPPPVAAPRRWGYVAALIAAGLAVFFLIPSKAVNSEPVDLVAMRGPQMAHVHAGNAAELRIELPDLADGEYRIEVVDSLGRAVWTGAVRAEGRRIRVSEPKPLRAGVYWVRLYTSAGKLMREFGLESEAGDHASRLS